MNSFFRTGLIGAAFLITLNLIACNQSKVDIDPAKYQGIFLANGQAYYGKLNQASGQYLKLNDVHYIFRDPQENSGQGQNPNLRLVKWGNELYGPEDYIWINRDQVIMVTDLNPEGQVAQKIREAKEKPQKPLPATESDVSPRQTSEVPTPKTAQELETFRKFQEFQRFQQEQQSPINKSSPADTGTPRPSVE